MSRIVIFDRFRSIGFIEKHENAASDPQIAHYLRIKPAGWHYDQSIACCFQAENFDVGGQPVHVDAVI